MRSFTLVKPRGLTTTTDQGQASQSQQAHRGGLGDDQTFEAAARGGVNVGERPVGLVQRVEPDAEVDLELLEQIEERELHEAIRKFGRGLEDLLPERRVAEAFAAMEPLADILERFFVEVLVMCDDERVRDNRIALLKELGRLFMDLADLSKLQVEGGEH